jgi:hypothetical protein
MSSFIENQVLSPEARRQKHEPAMMRDHCSRLLYKSMINIVAEYREGL